MKMIRWRSNTVHTVIKNSACHSPNNVDEFDKMRVVTGTFHNRLGLALIKRQSLAMTDYEYTPFLIPTELRKVWGIEEKRVEQ